MAIAQAQTQAQAMSIQAMSVAAQIAVSQAVSVAAQIALANDGFRDDGRANCLDDGRMIAYAQT